MAKYFAGLDVSTQSCKIVIINSDEQTLEFVDRVNYDKDLVHYKTEQGVIPSDELGVSESNPLMWVEAVDEVFKKALEHGFPMEQIKAISVSGQQHGLVAVDSNGNPVAITQSLVDAEVARLQADHDSKAYARARAEAYASIGDQLDMQYHDSVNGSRTWLDHIEAVKEAHPK